MKKKIEFLKARSKKTNKNGYSFRTSFFGVPMIIAVSNKITRAIAKDGKYSNVAMAIRHDTDTPDDLFGIKLAQIRAAKASIKSLVARANYSFKKDLEVLDSTELELLQEKYPDYQKKEKTSYKK
jgi:hypothetical protein